jgi:hypothetical protein
MRKRILLVFILVVLVLVLVPMVFATKPTKIQGYFDNFVPGRDPQDYCMHTLDTDGVPDDFITGCVLQPETPGVAQHGTFTGFVDGAEITCEYNLKTFDVTNLDSVARFTMNRCTGDPEVEGFHLHGIGWLNGLWEGSYHYHP